MSFTDIFVPEEFTDGAEDLIDGKFTIIQLMDL